MLDSFLQLIEDADVLSGWNSEGYDIHTVNPVRLLGKERTRDFCLWNPILEKPKDMEKNKKVLACR